MKMSSLIVEVKQGKLIGKENKSIINGKTFYTFQGIPYAKPPIGELRFQAPRAPESWQGIYDATYERAICVQIDFYNTKENKGTEDCLFLNISTPELPSDVKIRKPVMVFIHGGAFQVGSGSEGYHSADFLVERDVIVVTLNYRLHILGFLNLGVPSCPGNAGLKDQRLALIWVKENIDKFGGDSNNITIFGESAGASSIHYLTISPLSKGLFSKAIMQSGTAVCSWALAQNPYELGLKAGHLLGFQGDDREKLSEFLKEQEVDDLLRVVKEIKEEIQKLYPAAMANLLFIPSVEEIKEEAFLPELPEELFENAASVPIIHGANEREGIIYKFASENIISEIREDFSKILTHNFEIDSVLIPDLSEKIRKHYFGEKPIDENCEEEMLNLFTDLYFYRFYDVIDFKKHSDFPVFVYKFVYDGGLNFIKLLFSDKIPASVKGAAHADELGYLFYARLKPEVLKFREDDLKTIENMTTLWTNFAKTGNPSHGVNWKPFRPEEPCYLRIDADLTLVEGKIYGERMQFLKNLLEPVAKTLSSLRL